MKNIPGICIGIYTQKLKTILSVFYAKWEKRYFIWTTLPDQGNIWSVLFMFYDRFMSNETVKHLAASDLETDLMMNNGTSKNKVIYNVNRNCRPGNRFAFLMESIECCVSFCFFCFPSNEIYLSSLSFSISVGRHPINLNFVTKCFSKVCICWTQPYCYLVFFNVCLSQLREQFPEAVKRLLPILRGGYTLGHDSKV